METNVVKINALSEAEKETWWALFDIALQMPDGWAITGGSLMRLLLEESRHLADIALLSKVLSVTERRRIVGLSGKQKYRLKKGIQGSLSASSDAESVESLNRLLKILER